MELNSKIAADVDQKYQQLSSQIRNQNENFANLVKEKVNDRTQFEQEKAALQGKIKADAELVEKLQNYINDLNGKIQALIEAKVRINPSLFNKIERKLPMNLYKLKKKQLRIIKTSERIY